MYQHQRRKKICILVTTPTSSTIAQNSNQPFPDTTARSLQTSTSDLYFLSDIASFSTSFLATINIFNTSYIYYWSNNKLIYSTPTVHLRTMIFYCASPNNDFWFGNNFSDSVGGRIDRQSMLFVRSHLSIFIGNDLTLLQFSKPLISSWSGDLLRLSNDAVVALVKLRDINHRTNFN